MCGCRPLAQLRTSLQQCMLRLPACMPAVSFPPPPHPACAASYLLQRARVAGGQAGGGVRRSGPVWCGCQPVLASALLTAAQRRCPPTSARPSPRPRRARSRHRVAVHVPRRAQAAALCRGAVRALRPLRPQDRPRRARARRAAAGTGARRVRAAAGGQRHRRADRGRLHGVAPRVPGPGAGGKGPAPSARLACGRCCPAITPALPPSGVTRAARRAVDPVPCSWLFWQRPSC